MHALPTAGSLLGTAAGDSIGLPYENLSPARGAALLGFPDRHRLLFRRGMVSDDTDHACMTAVSLARSGGDPRLFARELARQLRWWIACLPAGTGLATARAGMKLWLGASPTRSGVPSAGNGPAMRAPVLGAAVEDLDLLRQLVIASTTLTHTDPRAIEGAYIVALAARLASAGPDRSASACARVLEQRHVPSDPAFARLIEAAIDSVGAAETTAEFSLRNGMTRGVSGFIVHTVPIALHAWLSHPNDVRRTIQACIACGGDTDTTAAIAAGIAGAATGPAGVPADWLAHLWAYPRTVEWMARLGESAQTAARSREPQPVPHLTWPAIPVRNLALLAIVLAHGFRRLAPPY